MTPLFVLGIDTGGSKCDAVVVSQDGTIVGEGRCDYRDPGSGRGAGGSGRSTETIALAVRRALDAADLPRGCRLVVSGRSAGTDGILPGRNDVAVSYAHVREQDGALALAGVDAGVVVLAGTGAFVFGRTTAGRELLLDALGPLLGDHGSAYHVGLLALRAVGKARWHARHATSLSDVLTRACADLVRPDRQFSLVEFMLQPRDRSEIAGLAALVDQEARKGDEIACRVLREAADAIAETLRDVVDRLAISPESMPMVATGSVATRSTIYWMRVCERASEIAPRLQPFVSPHSAAVGVALAAARQVSDVDLLIFRLNLLAGARAPQGHERTEAHGAVPVC